VFDQGRRERREGERKREREIVCERERAPINRLTGHSRDGHSGVGLSSLLSLPRKFATPTTIRPHYSKMSHVGRLAHPARTRSVHISQPSRRSFAAGKFRCGHFLGFDPGPVTLPVRTKPVRFTQHFLLSAGRYRCGSFLRTNPLNNPANILGRDIPVWAFPRF